MLQESKVQSGETILLRNHINPGIMKKQFIKHLLKDEPRFLCVGGIFPNVSSEKLKVRAFDEPQIRKLGKDRN